MENTPIGNVRVEYKPLDKMCDQPPGMGCLDRWSQERSVKDRMYYNWFVLNQPVQLPPSNVVNVPLSKENYACRK
jgi:hypothetical protein